MSNAPNTTAVAGAAAAALSERDALLYRTKVSEQTDRFDDMADSMSELVKTVQLPLTEEERNLLSVAFKNAVGSRRVTLRIINSLEAKQKARGQYEYVEVNRQYQAKVTKELSKVCEDIINLLESHLIKSVESDVVALVFYWKMLGDYYRYVCEFTLSEEQKEAAPKKANEAYEKATSIATAELTATHPVRLGLALNYSVFHFEILNQAEIACQIAKTAFDEALSQLDSVDEESYRDSTLIMQLLRDNLTLWTTDSSNPGTAPTGTAAAGESAEQTAAAPPPTAAPATAAAPADNEEK